MLSQHLKGMVSAQIAPKEDELKGLLGYNGPLGALNPPERFLCTMARGPRLLDKINLLILAHPQGGTFQASISMCPSRTWCCSHGQHAGNKSLGRHLSDTCLLLYQRLLA